MKYMKMLGLLVITTAAMSAIASPVAASVATSPPGTVYTGPFKAESEGYVTLHNAVATYSCVVSLEGKIEQHGAAVTAAGNLSRLAFTGCTNATVHNPAVGGKWEFHPLENGNAAVTWTGGKYTATMFGVECGYSTNSTYLGEVTGAKSPTGHATLHIKAVIFRTHGSAFCGSTGNWTAALKFTSPTGLAFS